MNENKFNKLELGATMHPADNVAKRCQKANHYWKRFGRKFRFIDDGDVQYIRRVR